MALVVGSADTSHLVSDKPAALLTGFCTPAVLAFNELGFFPDKLLAGT
jgi:hypothetical protein